MATRIPLPNGSIIQVANTLSTAKTITAVSNALPAVVTSTAHGLSNGDIVMLTSGWSKLDNRVARVSGVTTDTFQLEKVDTSNIQIYTPSGGTGSFVKVMTRTEITKVTDFTTSGGEQQFATVGYLSEDDDRQFPSNRNPQSVSIPVQDEPDAAYVAVVEGFGEAKIGTVLFVIFPSGGMIVLPGFVSITQLPTMSRNQVMTRTISFSLSSRSTRYTA
ncbi:phage tail protein [Pseudomonas rhizoryzae]|uniref:phage tail protein n=1 Tax=Pseudomonas rhizoryzae TaxID=2571129 RepID=UPI0010C1CB1F|nr:phage tail protein [Pseudomonas rhizoryzae]